MSYRSLLRLAGVGFFPLGFLARLPYSSSALAILVLLQGTTHSYAFAGIGGAVQSIAVAVGGPAVGALADRYGHRTVAVTAACANFLAWAALLTAAEVGGRSGMLGAGVLVGLTQPPVGALVRVHWARLVRARGRGELLPAALSYEASADELSFVAGPALVGLAATAGPAAPVVAVMLLLATSTLPFALRHTGAAVNSGTGTVSSARDLPYRPLAAMFLAMAAVGAVFGGVQTAVTVYADAVGRPGTAGLVYAGFGVGSAVTGAACAWLPARFSTRARYVTFAALLCVGMLVLFVGARLGSLPVAVALASCTVAPYMITLYALTEQLAPAERLATALTVLCAGGPLGTAVGQAVAGGLAQDHGVGGALLVAVGAAAGAFLLAAGVVLAGRTSREPVAGLQESRTSR
ncbi:major facilitator superfamily MFS_1 [Actinobacteria bacterium OK074]|nr:major facilitator superfamily MFS_1 [Actinobacteria bacterium OK074]